MLPVVPGSPSPSDTATPNRRPAPGTMLRLASLVGLVILAAAPGLARGAGTVPAPPTAGAGASSTGAEITAFGTFTATEALVVRRAFAGFMAPPFACGDDVAIGDDSWSFSCRYAAGHGLWVTLSRSDTLEAARAAFDAARGDQPDTYSAGCVEQDEHGNIVPVTDENVTKFVKHSCVLPHSEFDPE